MIGIIGAMNVEIDRITAQMTNKSVQKIGGVTYTEGDIGDKKVVAAVCGIGKVFAAICAQTMILRYSPEVIINTGVAGTLTNELNILDTVVASALVQHDMDTTYFGDPRGLISGINKVEFECDEGLAEKICENISSRYIRGIIASGDAFIADENKKRDIKETFNAVCCEMEGAAIAHVCYVNNIKCCVVRTISDGADGDKVMSYEAFCEKAAEKSAQIIINTINNL
ncbi:MAG: 5'-methylthioadenosine/adenosylhomocysteine nucleosidase [Clostridia bacterium]|nr:5'-methylthioadenosine/adenosylhomocysteine nucleosidase [Clostridia bacterium]